MEDANIKCPFTLKCNRWFVTRITDAGWRQERRGFLTTLAALHFLPDLPRSIDYETDAQEESAVIEGDDYVIKTYVEGPREIRLGESKTIIIRVCIDKGTASEQQCVDIKPDQGYRVSGSIEAPKLGLIRNELREKVISVGKPVSWKKSIGAPNEKGYGKQSITIEFELKDKDGRHINCGANIPEATHEMTVSSPFFGAPGSFVYGAMILESAAAMPLWASFLRKLLEYLKKGSQK